MNGVEFMKSVISILQKKILEKNTDFNMNTASEEGDGSHLYFYPIFKFEGEDLVIDTTRAKFEEFWNAFLPLQIICFALRVHQQGICLLHVLVRRCRHSR